MVGLRLSTSKVDFDGQLFNQSMETKNESFSEEISLDFGEKMEEI